MGNSPSATTAEQNAAASTEAQAMFRKLGVDMRQGVSLADWDKAFEALGADGRSSISRKDWFIKQGSTPMYDLFPKRHPASITRAEWSQAFAMLNASGEQTVCAEDWAQRRKVHLCCFPLGEGMHSWGVIVGLNFIALGEFAPEESARERWLQAVQDFLERESQEANAGDQEVTEPAPRLEQSCVSFEHAGWTMKTDEQFNEWIRQWVEESAGSKKGDEIKAESNEQAFALTFVSWLTNTDSMSMASTTSQASSRSSATASSRSSPTAAAAP